MSAETANIFPIAYGNEEETMLQVGPVVRRAQDYRKFGEPLDFIDNFTHYIPADIKHAPEMSRRHTQAGGVVYNGGVQGSANLERTTAECSTPTEFANAIQANERLLVAMLGNYVTDCYKSGGAPQMVRAQRRSVDSVGNTRASHDSLEIRNAYEWSAAFEEAKEHREATKILMLAHMATRSFISGAGYVSNNGPRFAAKIEHVRSIESYGFTNSAFRINTMSDTGSRFEVRCNDVNLSPWSLKTRIAASSLLFVAAHTPLRHELAGLVPPMLRKKEDFLQNSAYFNAMTTDRTGHLTKSLRPVQAADFQEKVFTLLADKINNYVDVDSENLDLIGEIVEYCQDFRLVIRGHADWTLLMDRSDLAAKYAKISRRLEQLADEGFDDATLFNVARAWDLNYDNIEIRPGDRGAPQTTYGFGYKLRDHSGFRHTLKDDEVQRAMYRPPETTRAKVRGDLIRKGLVESCEYATVTLNHDESLHPKVRGKTYSLSPVVNDPSTHAADADTFLQLIESPYIEAIC